MASAGRVLPLPKGAYSSTTTYHLLDFVSYQGSTYICKQTSTGNSPTNTTYWQIMAQGTESASVAGNYYGTCSTGASTSAKIVSIPATENFVLQVGDIIGIKFDNTNTANNPSLNVNNSGAKPIYYNNSAVSTSNLWASGEANRVTIFMYDGTNWIWMGHDVDIDTDTLSELKDTTISSASNGQVLMYDGTSSKWKNQTPTTTLAGLSDTQISSATDGQALLYNSTTQKWGNANISSTLAGLTDTEITSPTNEQALVYNSATQKWENGVSGTVRYNEQTDWVQIYYNGNWVNWKIGGMQLDPTKMELTQNEFIAICEQGLQSRMSLGAIIHVNNQYCNNLEVIDVNHEGTLNTVDVMAHTQVGNMAFGSSQDYNTSSVRTWINSDYIKAFDYDVRELMKIQQVTTIGVTQNDKAKLLSWKEIGLTNYYMDNTDGGTKYPVFTAGAYDSAILNRWRGPGNYGNSDRYWLRSRNTSNSNSAFIINSSGTCNGNNCTITNGVLPVLRF